MVCLCSLIKQGPLLIHGINLMSVSLYFSGICGVFLTVYRVKCKDIAISNNVEELACIGKVSAAVYKCTLIQ